jgi:hypothetical protein
VRLFSSADDDTGQAWYIIICYYRISLLLIYLWTGFCFSGYN